MADYRRVRIAGGCYFFTVALLNRRSTALVQHIDLLRRSVALARQRRPFHIDARVVLPDHMHCMWTLPDGDADYSSRWRHIKNTFSRGVPKTESVPVSWQHRVREVFGKGGIGNILFEMTMTMNATSITFT